MSKAATHHDFLTIDLMRGIAAFAVLIWHYQAFYFPGALPHPMFRDINEQPLYGLLSVFYRYGAAAVQLFWSISGFVFASAYIERRKTNREFVVARFARLYPLHLLTLLIVATIQIVSLHFTGQFQVYPYNDLYHFILNLFFASSWGFERGFSFNAPVWSVSVEVVIYGVFMVSVPLVSRLRFLGPILLLSAFYLLEKHGPHTLFWACGFYFYMGIAIFQFVKILGVWSIVPGIIALGVWRIAGYGNIDSMQLNAMPMLFAGILLCAAATDRSTMFKGIIQRLAWVGECTYSTYLIHMPIIMVTTLTFSILAIKREPILDSAWFLVGFVALVFGLGRLVYLRIELPAQHRLRRLLLSTPEPHDGNGRPDRMTSGTPSK